MSHLSKKFEKRCMFCQHCNMRFSFSSQNSKDFEKANKELKEHIKYDHKQKDVADKIESKF